MFQLKEIVTPSGVGRTAEWPEIYGTVVRLFDTSVAVAWHGTCVEEEMEYDEIISTGEFNDELPQYFMFLEKTE